MEDLLNIMESTFVIKKGFKLDIHNTENMERNLTPCTRLHTDMCHKTHEKVNVSGCFNIFTGKFMLTAL